MIRLFPCWPEDQEAAFRDLPARGGFMVSAERDATGIRAEIKSLAGGPCRVRWEDRRLPSVRCNGRAVTVKREGREIMFTTRTGRHYRLQ